jgi:hypothetical protein
MLLYTILIIFGVIFVAGLIAGSFDSIFYDGEDGDEETK